MVNSQLADASGPKSHTLLGGLQRRAIVEAEQPSPNAAKWGSLPGQPPAWGLALWPMAGGDRERWMEKWSMLSRQSSGWHR